MTSNQYYGSSEEELENTVVENSPTDSLESNDQEENSKTVLSKKDHSTDGMFGIRKSYNGTLEVGRSEIELTDNYSIDRTHDNSKYLIIPGFTELLTKNPKLQTRMKNPIRI